MKRARPLRRSQFPAVAGILASLGAGLIVWTAIAIALALAS